MAAEFHELSPYVFIGNPLTLAMIEVFAVPGALLGTILYPLGLDAPRLMSAPPASPRCGRSGPRSTGRPCTRSRPTGRRS